MLLSDPLVRLSTAEKVKVESAENDLLVVELRLGDVERKYSHDYFADKEGPPNDNELKFLAKHVTLLLLRR